MSSNDQPPVAEYVADMSAFRQQKDEFFGASSQSPIPLELRRAGFGGLKYFPPDLAYCIEARLTPFDTPEVVPLGSTQGDIRPMLRYGALEFTIMGELCHLVAFKNADDPNSHELFVPFRDATSGGETYGAGRYIEAEDQCQDDAPHTIILDFNLAYSPWCAYNISYSCTLPPPENRLSIPIMAGELVFPIDH